MPMSDAPTITIGDTRFALRLGVGDQQSLVAVLQAPAAEPFNDTGNLRRVTTALVQMVMEFAEAHGIADPEQMIKFAQDLLREEFYPMHAARQERLAQQKRPM